MLLEAMAHELPIIATDTMAIPEIVKHQDTGILVPPKNVDALKRAMIYLLTNPEERVKMGKRGRERLIKEFSVEKMVERTKKLYNDLLQH